VRIRYTFVHLCLE